MNWRACEREQDVMEAVQSGRLDTRWGEELRRHIAVCRDCADLALVTEYLQQENEAAAGEARLPTASFTWWKAQLRARRESTERALQPVRVLETVSVAAGFAVVVALLLWLLPALKFPALAGFLNSGLAIGTATAFVCLMGFVLYAVFAKD